MKCLYLESLTFKKMCCCYTVQTTRKHYYTVNHFNPSILLFYA